MKKLSIFLVALIFPMLMLADERLSIIYPADGSDTWVEFALTGYDSADKGLFINHDKFDYAVPGNMIKIYVYDVTEAAELRLGYYDTDKRMPGFNQRIVSGEQQVDVFLTQDMINAIKSSDLRIYGDHMKVNRVELYDGKAGALKEGRTIWTGYFWMDNWSTMDLFIREMSVDWSKYKEMIVYHQANRTNYVINVRANWEDNVGIISDWSEHVHGTKYDDRMVVDLTQVDIASILSSTGTDRLLVQGNKEGEDAFNITDIVLVEKDYTRSVTSGNYGTICLPRASASVSGATLYSIVDKDATGIIIEQVDAMEAGTPYIFQATDDELRVAMTGAEAAVQEANGLVGFLGDGTTAVPQNDNCYVIASNQLHLVDSEVTIATNRAYIDMDAINPIAPAPGRQRRVVKLADSEQVVTAVSNVTNATCQKVMENGRLLIVRDGVKYTVQGLEIR